MHFLACKKTSTGAEGVPRGGSAINELARYAQTAFWKAVRQGHDMLADSLPVGSQGGQLAG